MSEVMVSALCLCGTALNLSYVILGTRPRESLVADEDVKKPISILQLIKKMFSVPNNIEGVLCGSLNLTVWMWYSVL